MLPRVGQQLPIRHAKNASMTARSWATRMSKFHRALVYLRSHTHSAAPASEHTEEGFNVSICARSAVVVEVGAAATGAAVTRNAGKESFDVRVSANVRVVVEVRRWTGTELCKTC